MSGLSVYITHHNERSVCLPIVTVRFGCPGMSLNEVTTRMAAVSTMALPFMFVCSLILCSIMGSPSIIWYLSVKTMVAMSCL